jgi:hypothetical protein
MTRLATAKATCVMGIPECGKKACGYVVVNVTNAVATRDAAASRKI